MSETVAEREDKMIKQVNEKGESAASCDMLGLVSILQSDLCEGAPDKCGWQCANAVGGWEDMCSQSEQDKFSFGPMKEEIIAVDPRTEAFFQQCSDRLSVDAQSYADAESLDMDVVPNSFSISCDHVRDGEYFCSKGLVTPDKQPYAVECLQPVHTVHKTSGDTETLDLYYVDLGCTEADKPCRFGIGGIRPTPSRCHMESWEGVSADAPRIKTVCRTDADESTDGKCKLLSAMYHGSPISYAEGLNNSEKVGTLKFGESTLTERVSVRKHGNNCTVTSYDHAGQLSGFAHSHKCSVSDDGKRWFLDDTETKDRNGEKFMMLIDLNGVPSVHS